jgi:hypothetical protein
VAPAAAADNFKYLYEFPLMQKTPKAPSAKESLVVHESDTQSELFGDP